MYKKLILWFISGLLLILITAPTHGQNIQTIQLPPLQPITAENISHLQLLGTLENFWDISGNRVTTFTISPNHRWLVVNLWGDVLVYDLKIGNILYLETGNLGDLGEFSNNNQLYLLPTMTETLVYDVNTWDVIEKLEDNFIIHRVKFSADDTIIAATNSDYEFTNGIHIFETDTWTEHNLLPVSYTSLRGGYIYPASDSPFSFYSIQNHNYLLTAYTANHVYGWDYLNIQNYADPTKLTKSDLILELTSRTYTTPGNPNQSLPLFTYDYITDAIIDNRTGAIYTSVEKDSSGFFIDHAHPEGSWFAYRLDEFSIPDAIVTSNDNSEMNFISYFSSDGSYILVLDDTGLFVYNISTHKKVIPLTDINIASGTFFFFDTLSNAQLAFTAYRNHISNKTDFQIWDMMSGELLNNLPTDTYAGKAMISRDSQLLVIGEPDRIEFWGVPQP